MKEKQITLEVIQEDIDTAIKRTEAGEFLSRSCVISTAAQRQFGDQKIKSAFGMIYTAGFKEEYKGGEDLVEYMAVFDAGSYKDLKPQNFELIKKTYS